MHHIFATKSHKGGNKKMQIQIDWDTVRTLGLLLSFVTLLGLIDVLQNAIASL